MSEPYEPQILATPDIGWPVHYYKDDLNPNDPIAAICVKKEAPGQIEIVVFEPHTMPYYRTGVRWMGDDRRLNSNRPFRRQGIWDFPPYGKQRDSMKYHKDIIKKDAVKLRMESERTELLREERDARIERSRVAREGMSESTNESD